MWYQNLVRIQSESRNFSKLQNEMYIKQNYWYFTEHNFPEMSNLRIKVFTKKVAELIANDLVSTNM